jgi:hypothetical protein
VNVNYKDKICSVCKSLETELGKSVVCSHAEKKTEFAKYFVEELEQALAEVANTAIKDEHNNGKDLFS